MNPPNPGSPKPSRLHSFNIIVATLASLISVIGGIYSLKVNFFQNTSFGGNLAGIVRDNWLAKPLRLATVEVSDTQGEVLSTLSTNDDGVYELKNLKEGSYRIKTMAPLHEALEKKITIQKNATTTVDFSLTPAQEPTPKEINTITTEPVAPVYSMPKTASSPPVYEERRYPPAPGYRQTPPDSEYQPSSEPYSTDSYSNGPYSERDQT